MTTASLEVNGKLESEIIGTIADLLRRRGIDPACRFLAVAVNGSVIKRSDWEHARLEPGDAVEIVAPRQGG
ncbi:MAG: sulfur carrier protein ThiS [Proteobacteria bacterium]|nr:sulfur carrier protein ThiS [Pseudomonadota bacterium]MBI3499937.1 sulfur carrier protein ThiS [Pseudomonadota bacterium]